MSKWKSRKFWICVAALLGSLGSTIAGFATDNKSVAVVGVVCTMLSSAIYAAAEAYTDAARAYCRNDVEEADALAEEPAEVGFHE